MAGADPDAAAGRRAAVGLALAAAGTLYFVAFVFAKYGAHLYVSDLLGPFAVAGLAVAAAGMAVWPRPAAPGLLAAGLGLAAAAWVGFLLSDLGSVDMPGHALSAVGLLQGAWLAALWAFDPGHGQARVAALQVAFAVCALGDAWYFLTTIGGSGPVLLPSPGLSLAGFALASRSLGPLRPALPALAEPDPAEA